jgi:hypothetical protein
MSYVSISPDCTLAGPPSCVPVVSNLFLLQDSARALDLKSMYEQNKLQNIV